MIKDIYDELKRLVNGNTLDTFIPSVAFVFLSQKYAIYTASAAAIFLALLLTIIRLSRKQKWQYSIGGLIGVILATIFTFLLNHSKGFFVPKLISNGLIFLVCFTSLLFKIPLAAWSSHITRGWTKEWFLHEDVLPAYKEVTLIWTFFFFLRLTLLILTLNFDNLTIVFLVNFILGAPTTILLLILSYIYGIWRLRLLKGPSVNEFDNNLPQPWEGQKKGF